MHFYFPRRKDDDGIMRRFFDFLRHARPAYRLWLEREAERENAIKLAKRLSDLGFTWGGGCPARDVSPALKLAQRYGVEFHVGLAYCDCRAVLPQSQWVRPPDPATDPFLFGIFYRQPLEQISEVVAFGFSVQEAVCKCLENAARAKVVDPN